MQAVSCSTHFLAHSCGVCVPVTTASLLARMPRVCPSGDLKLNTCFSGHANVEPPDALVVSACGVDVVSYADDEL